MTQDFKRGAAHASQRLSEYVNGMLADGSSPEEVKEFMGNFVQVLDDWRSGINEMPSGNPWDWKDDQLAAYINEHRDKW